MTTIEREYARLVERDRDKLHAHSSRILRSADDADDAVQEALLRAWRALPSFEGRSSLRGWLQRIVTNASLDEIKRRPRPDRVVSLDLDRDAPGDRWRAPPSEPALDGGYLTREDFERALILAFRLLPARQRAVLILREAFGFSARETAARLGLTATAVNSSLQRARWRLDAAVAEERGEEAAGSLGDRRLREVVKRHVDAWERDDVDAVVAILAEESSAAGRSGGRRSAAAV